MLSGFTEHEVHALFQILGGCIKVQGGGLSVSGLQFLNPCLKVDDRLLDDSDFGSGTLMQALECAGQTLLDTLVKRFGSADQHLESFAGQLQLI